MQCMSRAWTNIRKWERKDSVFTIDQRLFIICNFSHQNRWKQLSSKEHFFEHSCVWTARDSNLRQNYEPVLTWHKMCISEVSVMANKSIVRHPQAKLLMKQIWHSIHFSPLYYALPGPNESKHAQENHQESRDRKTNSFANLLKTNGAQKHGSRPIILCT